MRRWNGRPATFVVTTVAATVERCISLISLFVLGGDSRDDPINLLSLLPDPRLTRSRLPAGDNSPAGRMICWVGNTARHFFRISHLRFGFFSFTLLRLFLFCPHALVFTVTDYTSVSVVCLLLMYCHFCSTLCHVMTCMWRQGPLSDLLPRDAMLARNMLSSCVCLCVCLSHAGIVSKRLNIR